MRASRSFAKKVLQILFLAYTKFEEYCCRRGVLFTQVVQFYCAACVDVVVDFSSDVLLLSVSCPNWSLTSALLAWSVFLGWLEPLVGRIAENPANVVCPVIDTIGDDTFEIQWSSYPAVGGFSWDLQVSR